MMTSVQLMAIRDELINAAKRDCEAALEVANMRGDNRCHVAAVSARRELAFTVDTIARRAIEAEHKAVARRVTDDGGVRP